MRYVTLALLALIHAPAFGQQIVGISGAVKQDSTVVLTGIAMGTKATAAPLRWDDFQDGVDGDMLLDRTEEGGTVWDLQDDIAGGYHRPWYSDSVQRFTGDITALHEFPGTGTPSANRAIAVIDDPSPTWYVSLWAYCHSWDATRPFTNSDNHKWFMFAGGGWASSTPDIRWEGYPKNEVEYIAAVNCANTTPVYQLGVSGGWDKYIDRWARIEVFVYGGSSPGASDGYMAAYVDGELVRERNGIVVAADCSDTDIGSMMYMEYWRPYSIPENGGQAAAQKQYTSEMYVDHSFARVEIGDDPVWANCTHREIQIPSAWSSTEITFTVNAGSFAAGDTAYVFVVDPSRNVSNSRLVVIEEAYGGGGGDPIPIGTPVFTLGSGSFGASWPPPDPAHVGWHQMDWYTTSATGIWLGAGPSAAAAVPAPAAMDTITGTVSTLSNGQRVETSDVGAGGS